MNCYSDLINRFSLHSCFAIVILSFSCYVASKIPKKAEDWTARKHASFLDSIVKRDSYLYFS